MRLRVRRALRRGRYAIRLTVVDAAGNRSSRALRASANPSGAAERAACEHPRP